MTEVRPAARRVTDPLAATLLALTFVTGIIDAVSFLGLGQVFSAMMTGNVLFLGFGIAGTAGAPVVAPLIAIGSFLGGGAAGNLLARTGAVDPNRTLALATVAETALLASAAIIATLITVEPDELSAYVLVALMAFAMGLRYVVVRELGVRDLPTTVLTVTLASLVSHAPGGRVPGLTPRGFAVLAMVAGAVTGALLQEESLGLALGVAAAITLSAGLAYSSLARRNRPS
jgi:uncharacterized membrane protein YoaK (UPF0700 family)